MAVTPLTREMNTLSCITLNMCGVLSKSKVTYPLWRLQWLCDYLVKQQPDVVALQEISRSMHQVLVTWAATVNFQVTPNDYDWSSHPTDHIITVTLLRQKPQLSQHIE